MKQNIMTYGASWNTDGKTFKEETLQSNEVSSSMVNSTFEFKKALDGTYGIVRRGADKYDVGIKKAIVTWQLNDYSKYIKTVRWDIKNTNYVYSTNYIVHLYTGRNATGTLIDSDYMALKGGSDRCIQMTNNSNETINAVSFKNDLANSFYYGFEKIHYVLETASDAQQAKFFAEAFVREFTCDGNGNIANDTWSTFASRISTMSEDALDLLKEAAHNDANLGAAVERYDYVISKYGTGSYTDFLHRTEEGGGYANVLGFKFIPIMMFDSSSLVIIIVAILLTSCIASSFVSFRRRHK